MIKNSCFCLLLLWTAVTHGQSKLRIAAASDLRFALDSVIIVFNKTTPGQVEAIYGSSGKLCEQIIHGAPFDLFLSADISYPQQLEGIKKTSSPIYSYAKGRLVIWSKKVNPQTKGIQSLTDVSIKKIAIANPAHAPYGKKAIESLRHYKVHDALQSKFVYGENISQAAQFVSTGAADIGIIALSLAMSPNMKKENGNYFLIPEESHQPLIQGAVLTQKGKNNLLASTFFEFLQQEQATAILQHFGFSRP